MIEPVENELSASKRGAAIVSCDHPGCTKKLRYEGYSNEDIERQMLADMWRVKHEEGMEPLHICADHKKR